VFRTEAVKAITCQAIDQARHSCEFLLLAYILMPDHLHLFCAPAVFPPTPLKQWVEFWRSHATRHWPRPVEKPIWQKDFFDRQLRSGESYRQKWNYVWSNPLVAAFVTRPDDWPYQGELNILSWHEPA
jgi:putative transposase